MRWYLGDPPGGLVPCGRGHVPGASRDEGQVLPFAPLFLTAGREAELLTCHAPESLAARRKHSAAVTIGMLW